MLHHPRPPRTTNPTCYPSYDGTHLLQGIKESSQHRITHTCLRPMVLAPCAIYSYDTYTYLRDVVLDNLCHGLQALREAIEQAVHPAEVVRLIVSQEDLAPAALLL